MTPTWFNTPARIAALDALAPLLVGTPWAANGDDPRLGLSCHNHPRHLLMKLGALPADFPKISGSPDHTRHSTISQIEPWLDERPEFAAVPRGERPLPGDLLGLRIYRCVDHLAIMLGMPEYHFTQVLSHLNVGIYSLADPTWHQRVLRVWRVKP